VAEPTERFNFANTRVVSQVEKVEDQLLFFVDLHVGTVTEDDEETVVSVGWNGDRTKFGVYVNGVLVHPERKATP
jgi:hypothetical protein